MPQNSHAISEGLNYQALFTETPTPYLVLDPALNIVEVNNAYLHATMRQRQELIGLCIFDAFPDNPDDPTANGVQNLRRSLELVLEIQHPDVMAIQKYDIPRPEEDGGGFEERYWSPINTPVLDSQGNVIWIIHRVEDVTAVMQTREQYEGQTQTEQALRAKTVQMELEIAQREQELREKRHQNQQLGELLSIASHELRTPLTSVTLSVQLAEHMLQSVLNSGDMDQLAGLQTVLEQGDQETRRVTRLVKDLLDISRIQVGKLELQKQTSDLMTIIPRTIDEQRAASSDRAITFASDAEVVLVDIDIDRIWQVITNYLTNALKYTSGKIDVRVKLDKPLMQVRVEVSDEGPGLSSEEQAQVFDRFYRAQGTSPQNGAEKGFGLGLYICKSIIKQHSGQVGVVSHLGEGTTFWFTLPLSGNQA